MPVYPCRVVWCYQCASPGLAGTAGHLLRRPMLTRSDAMLKARLDAFHRRYVAAVSRGEFEFWADAGGADGLNGSSPCSNHDGGATLAPVGGVLEGGTRVGGAGTQRFVPLLADCGALTIASPLISTPVSLPEPSESY